MATKSIDNNITILNGDKPIKVKQPFTMSSEQKSFMDFSIPLADGTNKRLAKITTSKNAQGKAQYFLSLDKSVLGNLSDKLKTVFGSTGVLEILPSSIDNPEKPISFDLKEKATGAFTVKIKSQDDGIEYTCRIHPNGIELIYGDETEVYLPEPAADGTPTIIAPSMSTSCFAAMLDPDNPFFASEKSLKKSPMYMVGTYLAAIDKNEGLPKDAPRIPFQRMPIPGTNYEVFILNLEGKSTYFTRDTAKKNGKTAMFQNGQLTDIDDVLFLNSQDDTGHSNDPYIAFESIIGSSTIHRYIDLPFDAKQGFSAETLQALSEFMNYYGKKPKQAESGQTKDLGSFGDFHFVAEVSDAKDEDELKTKIKSKEFKVNELKPKEGPELPPDEPEKPPEIDPYPFIPTPKKIVTKKELEDKGYWKKLSQDSSSIIMMLGILAMVGAIFLPLAAGLILSTIGAVAVAGGGVLSTHVDQINDPLLKLDKFVIDPLSRAERARENEMEHFWAKEYESIAADGKMEMEEERINNPENPEVSSLQRAFASLYGDHWKDHFDAFVGQEGLESRTQFVGAMDELAALPVGTEDEKRTKAERQSQFLREFFHEPYGEELSNNQVQALSQEIFGAHGNHDSLRERLHQLNGAQENYQALVDEQAAYLEMQDENKLNVAKNPAEGILANKRLTDRQKNDFVKRNAMALARYYVYDENFSETALREFTKSLPEDARNTLLESLHALQTAAQETRDTVALKQKYDEDIQLLEAYSTMVSDIQSEMQFINESDPAQEFVSEEMLAQELEDYLIAGSLAKMERLDQAMAFSLSQQTQEGQATNSALLTPVVETMRTALSDETAHQMALRIQERAKELKLAGFYEEMAAMWEADPAYMPFESVADGPVSMDIEKAIAEQTQSRLMAHVLKNIPEGQTEESIRGMKTNALLQLIQDKKVPAPTKDSPLAHMVTAYHTTQKIETEIQEQLSFANIAAQVNAKGPNGKLLVDTKSIDASMKEMEEKYPKLKSLAAKDKTAIVTIALAYEHRKKIGEVNSTKDKDADNRDEQSRFLAANQEGIDIIQMALDGSLGIIAKNLYFTEGYTKYYHDSFGRYPRPEKEARRTAGKHVSYYNKHEYKFIKHLKPEQKTRLKEINPKNWIEMQTALQEVMEQDLIEVPSNDPTKPAQKKLVPHVLASGLTIQETHRRAQLKAIAKWRKKHNTEADKVIADRMEQDLHTAGSAGSIMHLATFDETARRFLTSEEVPNPAHQIRQAYTNGLRNDFTLDIDYGFGDSEFNAEIKRTEKKYRQDIKDKLSKQERKLGKKETARVYTARRKKLNKNYQVMTPIDEETAEDVIDSREQTRRQNASKKAEAKAIKYTENADTVLRKAESILSDNLSSSEKAIKLNEMRKELAKLDIILGSVAANTDFNLLINRLKQQVENNNQKKAAAVKARENKSAEAVKKDEAYEAAQIAEVKFLTSKAIFEDEFKRVMALSNDNNSKNKIAELEKLKDLMKSMGLSSKKIDGKSIDWEEYQKQIKKEIDANQKQLEKDRKKKYMDRLSKKRKIRKSIAAKKLKQNVNLAEEIVGREITASQEEVQQGFSPEAQAERESAHMDTGSENE